MNRERLAILRDHLPTIPEKHFDMREWKCGTTACIGGWAETLWKGESADDSLGLTYEQSEALFFMENTSVGMSDVTIPMAVAAIQSMLDNPDDGALPVWPEPAA